MVKEQALLWKKKLTSPKLTVYLFNEVNKSLFLTYAKFEDSQAPLQGSCH